MNKLNSLVKLAIASAAGTITAIGITAVPAQAQALEGTFEWDNGTDSFIGEVDLTTLGNTFDVQFSPDDIAAIFIASGDFANFYTPPLLEDLVPSGPTGTFENVLVIADPLPPGVVAEAEYELSNDLVFTFDTDDSGDASAGDLVATLEAGALFLGEEILDGSVEFELVIGEFLLDAPGFDTTTADASAFEFEQTPGSPGGGFVAQTTIAVPEPGTILGLLAVGGLGLGLKRKKQ
jgi:hypothetical protein